MGMGDGMQPSGCVFWPPPRVSTARHRAQRLGAGITSRRTIQSNAKSPPFLRRKDFGNLEWYPTICA